MRLWSINPGYLDSKGLVALWREGLLAQKVLLGKTTGYKNHPQLIRFKETDNSVMAIADYLRYVADEADKRNYSFNRDKIARNIQSCHMTVTKGQLEYEFEHLLSKLKVRAPYLYNKLKSIERITSHPIFIEVDGGVEEWEVIQHASTK
jgi:hypothetical protein